MFNKCIIARNSNFYPQNVTLFPGSEIVAYYRFYPHYPQMSKIFANLECIVFSKRDLIVELQTSIP